MEDQSAPNASARLRKTPLPASRFVPAAKITLGVILVIAISAALYNITKVMFLDRQILRFSPRTWVNLEEKNSNKAAITAGDEAALKPLRIAVAPIISPERSLEMYQNFAEYLADKLERKPVSSYQPTYLETNDMVHYRRCDVAIVCTYPFIRGEKEFGMEALVVPQVKGATVYRSLILVPRSSKAATLLDLRGKRFASADVVSTTGWLFPATLLMKYGQDPNHFFGEHIITHGHDRSLQAVVDGFVDGAAVHGLVYDQMIAENPSISDKVRVLAQSPPFGIPPVVVNPGLDPMLKKEVRSVLLNMDNDERGRQILKTLQIEKFVVPPKGHFDSIRNEVARLEGWK